jgi:hypothetical protein
MGCPVFGGGDGFMGTGCCRQLRGELRINLRCGARKAARSI